MKDRILFFIKDKENKWLLISFLALGLVALFLNFKTEGKVENEFPQDSFSADTVIPAGFVLVPVEIQNMEALRSLIGKFAVVDLFTTTQLPHQKGGMRVGRRLRLIRAPLNPQTFAVLVPESESGEVLAATGPFAAVIQNPNNQAEAEIIKKKIHISGVEYFKGGHRD